MTPRCTDESFEHKYWFSFFSSGSSDTALDSNSITTVLVACCGICFICTNNHNSMRPSIFIIFVCLCIYSCFCICIAAWHNGGGHEWGMPVGHVGASGQFWGIHQRMLRLALFLSTSWSLRLGAATSWSFSGIVIKRRRIQIDLVCNILLNSTSAATNLETSTDR